AGEAGGGMRRIAEHGARLGRRRVGVVMRTTQPGEKRAPGPAVPILEGIEAITNGTIRGRLQAVARVFPDAVRVEAGGRDSAAGTAAARALLSLGEAPSAILAQNDILAAGAVSAARGLGLEVPRDITITGFDGIEVPWLDVPLTTVKQPLRGRGREAGRLVGELLNGGSPANMTLPVSFRAGATAAPPRTPRK